MKKIYGWIIGLILLGFALFGVFLTIAPDRIPVHYSMNGQVDRWGSKYEFLILPFLNLASGLILALLGRYEGKKGREMNEKVVGMLNIWILVLFNVIWLFFMGKAVDLENPGIGIGELPAKLLLMILTASFIPVGNVMPKAERNSIFGLRTKWSVANDWCWQQSQRIGGYVLVVAGIVGVVLSALLPVVWAGYAVIVLMLVMMILCCYASYRVYMRSQNQ